MNDVRLLFWDCFAGISGDMALGSLLDAGAPPEGVRAVLSGLPLEGWTLEVHEEKRGGLRATKVKVLTGREQPHRRLPDIVEIIRAGGLPEPVARDAVRVFTSLARAEARVHGVSPDRVHFHETGAVDAIVEIIGTVAALHLLQVEQVRLSPLPLSRGFVQCAHGTLPVPAPAVLELIRGFPTRPAEVEAELVTPTGAALAVTLASTAGGFPGLIVEEVGYGAGTATLPFPNLLRAVLGRAEPPLPSRLRTEGQVTVLETVLDDVNPEHHPYVLERLLAAGALDAYLTPLIMKKGRPGIKLTVIADADEWNSLVTVILKETGTLGLRVRREDRVVLDRRMLTVDTDYGPVRVKVALLDGRVLRVKPEFEDCRACALQHRVPLRTVSTAAERAAEALLAQERQPAEQQE